MKIRKVDEKQRFHLADVKGVGGSSGSPVGAASHAPAPGVDLRAVVLVEGTSDKLAVETLAERRGRNLEAEGISIVPIGGAQAIGRFITQFGPQGLDLKLAGLCDAAEERNFQRGLERAGLGSDLTRADLERLGFYVCVADLEEELIRALGAASVEEVVDAQGDLGRFRTLQKQPEWRGRTTEEQLRRFMGSGGRRKVRYAQLLVEALDLTGVPRPLDRVLAHVCTSHSARCFTMRPRSWPAKYPTRRREVVEAAGIEPAQDSRRKPSWRVWFSRPPVPRGAQ